MTERLYYNDSSLLEFKATVLSCRAVDDRFHTVLDRTAFYPTSGGQSHDTGTLNDQRVVDVFLDDEPIVHVTEDAVGKEGDTVSGRIDPDRRHRHCQQHTAQHILSHVFHRYFGFATASVHLGEEYGAVELDIGAIPSEQVEQAERLANELVAANEPIDILFVDEDQIDELPLRRPPKKSGRLRVIRIGQEEYVACGGTHCRSTAEVGWIKLIAVERLRKRALVKFLSGNQAFEDYRERWAATSTLTRELTCHHNDLPERIKSIRDELAEQKKQNADLYRELLPQRVEQIIETNSVDGSPLVAASVDLPDPKLVAQLAGLIAERSNGVVLLAAVDRMVITAPEGSDWHAGKLARKLIERADGLKGGGNQVLAQMGGAVDGQFETCRQALIEELSRP